MSGELARALSMPLWADSGLELPESVEVRRKGDLAALCLKNTTQVVGFVPSRFDRTAIASLLSRLGVSR